MKSTKEEFEEEEEEDLADSLTTFKIGKLSFYMDLKTISNKFFYCMTKRAPTNTIFWKI